MPKIESWDNLPPGIRQHLIDRMHDRLISIADLNRLRLWIESQPEVPETDWYKDFGSFKICGAWIAPENIPPSGASGQRRSRVNSRPQNCKLVSFWNSERVIPPEMVLGSATRDSAMGGHIVMSYSNQITRCSRAVAWARLAPARWISSTNRASVNRQCSRMGKARQGAGVTQW